MKIKPITYTVTLTFSTRKGRKIFSEKKAHLIAVEEAKRVCKDVGARLIGSRLNSETSLSFCIQCPVAVQPESLIHKIRGGMTKGIVQNVTDLYKAETLFLREVEVKEGNELCEA